MGVEGGLTLGRAKSHTGTWPAVPPPLVWHRDGRGTAGVLNSHQVTITSAQNAGGLRSPQGGAPGPGGAEAPGLRWHRPAAQGAPESLGAAQSRGWKLKLARAVSQPPLRPRAPT